VSVNECSIFSRCLATFLAEFTDEVDSARELA